MLQQYLADNPTALGQGLGARNSTVLQQFLTSSPAALEQFLTDPANAGVLQQFLASDPALLQQFLTANPAALQTFLSDNIPGTSTSQLQQFLPGALLNLFRVTANLPGSGNQATGGLLSTFDAIGSGTFIENVTPDQVVMVTTADQGGTAAASFAQNVTFEQGGDTIVTGLLANVTVLGSGQNTFVIEDLDARARRQGQTPDPRFRPTSCKTRSRSPARGPMTGSTSWAGRRRAATASVVLTEPVGTTGDTVDFSNFLGGGINIDLNLGLTADQAVSRGAAST